MVQVNRVKHINLHDEGVIFEANCNALNLDTANTVQELLRQMGMIQLSTFVFLSTLIYRTMFPFAIIVLMRPLALFLNQTLRVKVMSQRRKREIKKVMLLCLLI